MQLKGEHHIAAPQQKVWDALNDPDILQQCIPGCESLERSGDNRFTAKATNKIGPVKATFTGDVELSDLNPPQSYRISGEGKGGAAGFAKGGAFVTLQEKDGGTLLAYDVDAKVSGKIAQLGQRLIDSAAKKMADDFFKSFAAVFTASQELPVEADEESGDAIEAKAAHASLILFAAAIAAAGVLAWLFLR